MPRRRVSKSLRIYIRREKARIRRAFLTNEDRLKEIRHLYERIRPRYTAEKNAPENIEPR